MTELTESKNFRRSYEIQELTVVISDYLEDHVFHGSIKTTSELGEGIATVVLNRLDEISD